MRRILRRHWLEWPKNLLLPALFVAGIAVGWALNEWAGPAPAESDLAATEYVGWLVFDDESLTIGEGTGYPFLADSGYRPIGEEEAECPDCYITASQ